ncbi:MAG: sigma-70 family RNA polymerase sigma factor [Verrucomicrobia bacterium]|nr:sigma-70 family RNA polymerase sigma factor [Verrucomicrobiota bacterium]
MSEQPTDPSQDPDTQRMLRVKRGDEEAFQELVERWNRPVIGFIHRTLPDPDEAEDLAQSTFVQLWRTAGRYQPTARFSTFLFTIARNLCLNEIRRRVRHPADPLEEPREGDEDHAARQIEDPRQRTAGDEAGRAELFRLVDQALDELPEKQRTALMLCREGELSYEEIAEVLGTSLQATKSLIHRARLTLRQRLKPYLSEGLWHPGPDDPGPTPPPAQTPT